ncbi:MAG: hypothetical protein QOF01_1611 [Thermomicrobiales bacterium]|jgi:hypothetical protein|nr:hypothetical protein [Thermomicrobiales bacterium]
MRRLSLVGSLLVIALFATLTVARTAAAQDATPAVDMSPNADECTIEPRRLEELQALVGTPFPEGAGEATSFARQATQIANELPEGTAADEATVQAITAAVRRQMACFNAGNYLGGFAGTTDEFIISQVGFALFDEDLIAAMTGTPVPLPEEQQTTLIGVREVRALPDGRVAALVDYTSPIPPAEGINGVETDLWVFEQVEGEWLLDEVTDNLEGQHGPSGVATPTA